MNHFWKIMKLNQMKSFLEVPETETGDPYPRGQPGRGGAEGRAQLLIYPICYVRNVQLRNLGDNSSAHRTPFLSWDPTFCRFSPLFTGLRLILSLLMGVSLPFP